MAEVWTPMAPAASLWADTAEKLPAFPKLAGERQADVVIVGAGYTGLSAAHHIAKSGVTPVVLEANHPGWGASGRNGGVITAKFRLSFRDIDRAHRHVAITRAEVRAQQGRARPSNRHAEVSLQAEEHGVTGGGREKPSQPELLDQDGRSARHWTCASRRGCW